MRLSKSQIKEKRVQRWKNYYKYENRCLKCGHTFKFISKTVVKNTIIEVYECTECGEISIRKRSEK
jgi:transcription elongation factor Elf1